MGKKHNTSDAQKKRQEAARDKRRALETMAKVAVMAERVREGAQACDEWEAGTATALGDLESLATSLAEVADDVKLSLTAVQGVLALHPAHTFDISLIEADADAAAAAVSEHVSALTERLRVARDAHRVEAQQNGALLVASKKAKPPTWMVRDAVTLRAGGQVRVASVVEFAGRCMRWALKHAKVAALDEANDAGPLDLHAAPEAVAAQEDPAAQAEEAFEATGDLAVEAVLETVDEEDLETEATEAPEMPQSAPAAP